MVIGGRVPLPSYFLQEGCIDGQGRPHWTLSKIDMELVNRIKGVGTLVLSDPVSFLRRCRGWRRDPLFVFQMGKVASRTVSNTLEEFYRVRHSHISGVFDQQIAKYGNDADGYKNASSAGLVGG